MTIREDGLRNFSFYYPYMADDVVDFKIFYYTKRLIKMRNGDVYIYDNEFNTIRKMPDNPNDMTEQECREVFGWTLAHIMRMEGITQDRLSEMTGISQQAISSYICGRRSPTLYAIDQIAKALNCSADDFRYTGF